MRKLFVLTTIILWSFIGRGRGTGLPCSSQHTMKPSYGKPQSIEDNPPPYKLYVLDSKGETIKYYKNEIYTIILNSTEYFRAFLLQGRLSTRQGYLIGHLRAGEFLQEEQLWNEEGIQIQKCTPTFNDSITNLNNEKKYSIEVKWTPRRNDGAIQFVATIIQDHETYWVQWSPETGLILPDNDAKFTEQISVKNGLQSENTKIGESKLIVSADRSNLSSLLNVPVKNEASKEIDDKNGIFELIPDTKLPTFASLKPIIHIYETSLESKTTTEEVEQSHETETVRTKKIRTTTPKEELPEITNQELTSLSNADTTTTSFTDTTEHILRTENMEENPSTTSNKKVKYTRGNLIKTTTQELTTLSNDDTTTTSFADTTEHTLRTENMEENPSTISNKKVKYTRGNLIKTTTQELTTLSNDDTTTTTTTTTENLNTEFVEENPSTVSKKKSKTVSGKTEIHSDEEKAADSHFEKDSSRTDEITTEKLSTSQGKTKSDNAKIMIHSGEEKIMDTTTLETETTQTEKISVSIRAQVEDELKTSVETEEPATTKKSHADDDLTTTSETELPSAKKFTFAKPQIGDDLKNSESEILLLSGHFDLEEPLSVTQTDTILITTLKAISESKLKTMAIAIDDETTSETIVNKNEETILLTESNVIETEPTKRITRTTTEQSEKNFELVTDSNVAETEQIKRITFSVTELKETITEPTVTSLPNKLETERTKLFLPTQTVLFAETESAILSTVATPETSGIESFTRDTSSSTLGISTPSSTSSVNLPSTLASSPATTEPPSIVVTSSPTLGTSSSTIGQSLPSIGTLSSMTELPSSTIGTSSPIQGASSSLPVSNPPLSTASILPSILSNSASPNLPLVGKQTDDFNVHGFTVNDGVSTGSPKTNENDPCANFPCNNNGTCKNVGGEKGFMCNCTQDWMGDRCLERNYCSSNQCLHGGVCSNAESGYLCDCQNDWAGDNCELPCPALFCQNNGSCFIDKAFGEYKCLCKKGWTGAKCETDINECEPQPCMNGGTCVDRLAAFECRCAPGYMGERCHRPCQDIYQSCESWRDEDKCEQLRPTTKFFDINCAKTCERCIFDNDTIHTITPLPPVLEPLDFVIGTWSVNHTTAKRFPLDFPNAPNGYFEEVKFFISNISMFGTPYINYTTIATNNANNNDVQTSVGFMTLRPLPEPIRVAIMSTGNEGVTVIEEGLLKEKVMNFSSEYFAVHPPNKSPKSISRKFYMNGDYLVESVDRTTWEGITESFTKYYSRKEKYFSY